MEEKRYADYIIENDTTEAELHLRVDELIGTLQKMRRKIMHSRSARHKTLPQKQKCIWGRRIWQKSCKKKKYTQNTGSRKNGGRNGLWIIFAGCCIALAVAAVFQKPVRRHFSYPMEYEAEVRRACENMISIPALYLRS